MNASMKCDDALLEMLGADPQELRGDGQSPLAEHIHACTRCGAVASEMLEEMSALASAVAAGAVTARPVRWRAPALVLAGAAAVLIAAYPKEQSVESAPSAQSAASVSPAVAVASPAQMPTPSVRNAAPRRTNATPMPATTISAPYESPAPFEAVRVSAAPIDSLAVAETTSGLVSVTPPPGVHARVTQTRNPSITVVWLSKK